MLHKHFSLPAVLALGLLAATPSAHATFAQPLHGGCYKTAPNVCRIHIEPFTVPVDSAGGERAAQFRIYANNASGGASFTLWEFSTSASYSFKPVGNFSPTLPAEDFTAECGQTYSLSIQTRGDTAVSTGTFGNAGVTAQFICPN